MPDPANGICPMRRVGNRMAGPNDGFRPPALCVRPGVKGNRLTRRREDAKESGRCRRQGRGDRRGGRRSVHAFGFLPCQRQRRCDPQPSNGWTRDEDKAVFGPNPGINRIAVVVTPQSNSKRPAAPRRLGTTFEFEDALHARFPHPGSAGCGAPTPEGLTQRRKDAKRAGRVSVPSGLGEPCALSGAGVGIPSVTRCGYGACLAVARDSLPSPGEACPPCALPRGSRISRPTGLGCP
jgi:hypothetical protein